MHLSPRATSRARREHRIGHPVKLAAIILARVVVASRVVARGEVWKLFARSERAGRFDLAQFEVPSLFHGVSSPTRVVARARVAHHQMHRRRFRFS